MTDLEIELRYARAAIWEVAKMGGEYLKLMLQYIGWFAPVNDKLSFEQIYAHLIQNSRAESQRASSVPTVEPNVSRQE